MADKDFDSPIDSVNEAWFDAMIRHQIFLMRMSGGLRNKVNAILRSTELDIAGRIAKANLSGGATPQSLARLQRLLKEVNGIRNEAWDVADKTWINDMFELAGKEPVFVGGALQTVVPVILELDAPSPQLLRSIVTTRPFQGKTMRQWLKDLRRADVTRIDDEIKKGVVQGTSNRDIVRNIIGTKALKGRDGVTEISRANVAAITRTSTNAIANQARREFFIANNDIFTREEYVATLDARTSAICRSLDGKTFPIGQGPIPPVHINCRSLRIAVIDGESLGKRPMKTTTERGLLRQFTKENNLKKVTKRKDLPFGTKTKFDTFARREIRLGTGRVPNNVTYQQFLERQSLEFQEDVLGKSKAKLFRDGGLTVDKFVNRVGDELTLEQLAKKDASAFVAAGLDPEEFLN